MSQKTRHYILLSIASPNINRFSKFFHHQTQQEIYNKAIIKDFTTPIACIATLPCEIWMSKTRNNLKQGYLLVNDKL